MARGTVVGACSRGRLVLQVATLRQEVAVEIDAGLLEAMD